MVKGLLVFGGAFIVSVTLAVLGSGCVYSDDCNCPKTPPRPQAQAPLPDLEVASYDDLGALVETPVKPESGTIEVTGNSVLIVYEQDGVEHRVSYAVTGPD